MISHGVEIFMGTEPIDLRWSFDRLVGVAVERIVHFEYTPRETSAAVGTMFQGFSGYVQADAKNVFDVLFRAPDEKPPDDIKRLRNVYSRPHVDAFFLWAEAEHQNVRAERGPLRSALGYVIRQKDPLMRFLEDGRLRLDNNHSERELRRIAVGRKAWLFTGSDDHATSAGHLFSLIASARLHRLDPETYLRDLFRALGHWPRDRYIELAPKYWAATRARLNQVEIDAEAGPLTIPVPPTPAAQQSPSN